MVEDLNGAADLTKAGREVARRRIAAVLTARLEFVADRRADPAIGSEEITAPLFITGMPRSGTTFLHGLMAQDPRNRAPVGCDHAWRCRKPAWKIAFCLTSGPHLRHSRPSPGLSRCAQCREDNPCPAVRTSRAFASRRGACHARPSRKRLLQRAKRAFFAGTTGAAELS
ncbi:sulfotransferase [Novosphingobium taihuense]